MVLVLQRQPGMKDGDALGALFRDHARYVAGVAVRLLGRDDEVDDVVQDVFLAAASRLETLREAGAIRGWLATITVRVAARRLRRRRLRRLFFLDRQDPEAWPVIGPVGEHHVLLRRVYQVLDDMSPRLRIAWSLRYLEAESLEDVARLCGCSLATAKRRIAAAHERVAEILRDE